MQSKTWIDVILEIPWLDILIGGTHVDSFTVRYGDYFFVPEWCTTGNLTHGSLAHHGRLKHPTFTAFTKNLTIDSNRRIQFSSLTMYDKTMYNLAGIQIVFDEVVIDTKSNKLVYNSYCLSGNDVFEQERRNLFCDPLLINVFENPIDLIQFTTLAARHDR